jgi:hypothetical protein
MRWVVILMFFAVSSVLTSAVALAVAVEGNLKLAEKLFPTAVILLVAMQLTVWKINRSEP